MKQLTLLLIVLFCTSASFASETQEKIILNHVGFTPGCAKFCLMKGTDRAKFDLYSPMQGKAVYTGVMIPQRGDFGEYAVGDFSEYSNEGMYVIRTEDASSAPFRIAPNIYQNAINNVLHYFSKQRCGNSKTGYNAPCHLEDGLRVDNNEYQNTSGGWHDACDVRKWVGATIYGMIGMSHLLEIQHPDYDNPTIRDELKWGNDYFLRMQEPEGFVMHNCGGDIFEHGDQNHWTDNKKGTNDDRLIQTAPAPNHAQFNFIQTQAFMARFFKDDADYAKRCQEAAVRCMKWCIENNAAKNAGQLGAAIDSWIHMYKTFDKPEYKKLAQEYAQRLLDLQVTKPIDDIQPVRGFFKTSPTNANPYKEIYQGCWQLIALCDLVETFPNDPSIEDWKNCIEMYCKDYLLRMSKLNNFGIVPYGLYRSENPGGQRKLGDYYYRWFMKPDQRWWVGINANLASAGVGLMKASRILSDAKLEKLAQRQLDWIIGVNPFNASTMTGVGRNHPSLFITSEFDPPTPNIPGGVMNGIGGTKEDLPDLKSGSWQTCEYWTPMVGYTLWLMAELQHPQG